jgi:membrane protein YqaA with SNARE-associated domain
MRDTLLHAPLLLCVFTLLVAAAASLLPVSPLEPLLFAVAASVPAPFVLPVIVLATVGHMAAKTLVYLGSRHAGHAVPTRRLVDLERVRALISRSRPTQVGTVLVSGLVGTPPFYLVTMCCGALRLPLCDYLVAGGVGRGLRFAVLALLPRFVGAG